MGQTHNFLKHFLCWTTALLIFYQKIQQNLEKESENSDLSAGERWTKSKTLVLIFLCGYVHVDNFPRI